LPLALGDLPKNMTRYYEADRYKNDSNYYFNKFERYDAFVYDTSDEDRDTYDEYDPASGIVIRHGPDDSIRRRGISLRDVIPLVAIAIGVVFVCSVCIYGLVKICLLKKANRA